MTVPQEITQELQKVAPSAIIELLELRLVAALHGSNDIYRFHSGVNGKNDGGNVVWAGNTYTAFPVECDGFEYSGNGQLPRPRLRVANVLSTITTVLLAVNAITPGNDLLGAKVIRRRTLARYLDAVNFPERRNLFTETESLDAAAWPKSNASVLSNQVLAPDGNTTADKIIENTVATTHYAWRTVTKPATSAPYTVSVYVKAAERSFVRLYLWAGTSTNRIDTTVNLNTGAVTYVTSNGTFTGGSCDVTDGGNGWYRISVSGTSDTTTVIGTLIAPSVGPLAGNSGYAGDGTSGIYVWGAQIEAGGAASAYQAIGTTWSQNPYGTPDPTAEFPEEVYYISRKVVENRDVVEFELAAAFDLQGVRAPKRQCIANVCQWTYKSAECGYTPVNTFTGTYSRTATTVTVTATAHGLSVGDNVHLNFTSGTAAAGAYLVRTITANTFTVTTAASGSTTGSVTASQWYTDDDVVTTTAIDDVCGKRVDSCKARFGSTAALPFGSFPGIGSFTL
jgi:lambda family phage minor tail protein L